MLSNDYSNLIKQNSEISGFATLLDPEAFQKLLQPMIPVEDIQLKQIRFKPRRNCVATYEMKVSGISTDVYAKAYAPYGANKIRKTLEQMSARINNSPRKIALEKEAIVVFFFPADGKLSLAHLVEPEKRARLMKELFPNDKERWESEAQYLRYRAERRYSAQLNYQGKPWAFVKAYTRMGYPAGKIGARAFCSKGSLQTPKLLGSSDKHYVLAFEWIPDAIPLKKFLSAPDLDFGTLETVGQAVAEMHSQDAGELTPLSREDEAAELMDRANLFCTLCPHLSDQALSLASRLSKLVCQQPPMNRPIHGDFYMGQIMAHGDKVVIVDFDQAALGDPARDFGLLVAQLTRDVLRGELAPERFAEAESALLQGYRSKVDEGCFARIPMYTALGLFRLAAEPFRLCEPDWPRRMEAILQKTEEFLQIHP